MALGPTESGALWTSGTNVLKSEQSMVELTHVYCAANVVCKGKGFPLQA